MSGMPSAPIPAPVVFDLDVAENARLRDCFIVANGPRVGLYLAGLSLVLQFLPPLLRLYRYRGNDPFDWALLGVLAVLSILVLSAIFAPGWWQRLLLKPQFGTIVAFDAKKVKRLVAFTKIRSVQLTPGSLVIMGSLQPIVLIPKRALPDGGEGIMSFFEDRLVAKGRLYRAATGRTTIVNTVSFGVAANGGSRYKDAHVAAAPADS
jgi:hypothetical protein